MRTGGTAEHAGPRASDLADALAAQVSRQPSIPRPVTIDAPTGGTSRSTRLGTARARRCPPRVSRLDGDEKHGHLIVRFAAFAGYSGPPKRTRESASRRSVFRGLVTLQALMLVAGLALGLGAIVACTRAPHGLAIILLGYGAKLGSRRPAPTAIATRMNPGAATDRDDGRGPERALTAAMSGRHGTVKMRALVAREAARPTAPAPWRWQVDAAGSVGLAALVDVLRRAVRQ